MNLYADNIQITAILPFCQELQAPLHKNEPRDLSIKVYRLKQGVVKYVSLGSERGKGNNIDTLQVLSSMHGQRFKLCSNRLGRVNPSDRSCSARPDSVEPQECSTPPHFKAITSMLDDQEAASYVWSVMYSTNEPTTCIFHSECRLLES